jgi:hypothetical protein
MRRLSVLLLALLATPAFPAITRATGNCYLGASASSATSVSRAFTNSVTAGSLLVAVCLMTNTDEAQTVSDGTNTWTSNAIRLWHGNLAVGIQIGYAANAVAGATTVTCSSAAGVNRSIYVCEYAGVATTSPVDGTPVSASSDGTASNPDPGGITSTGGAVFIGAGVLYPAGAATEGVGYTEQVESTAGIGGLQVNIEDQIFSSAQTNQHPKYDNDFNYWPMLGIAFKEASGGGGGAAIPRVQRHRKQMSH